MMKTVVRTFPGHTREAVFEAAVQAVKSLGHEPRSADPVTGMVDFHAVIAGRRDRKEWSVTVSQANGVAFAIASRGALVGGKESTVITVGQEIFQTMDTILA